MNHYPPQRGILAQILRADVIGPISVLVCGGIAYQQLRSDLDYNRKLLERVEAQSQQTEKFAMEIRARQIYNESIIDRNSALINGMRQKLNMDLLDGAPVSGKKE